MKEEFSGYMYVLNCLKHMNENDWMEVHLPNDCNCLIYKRPEGMRPFTVRQYDSSYFVSNEDCYSDPGICAEGVLDIINNDISRLLYYQYCDRNCTEDTECINKTFRAEIGNQIINVHLSCSNEFRCDNHGCEYNPKN